MSREYRIYFDQMFYKNIHGYWVCTTNQIPWAHRWVWINNYGDIPEGMCIHHIDNNKDNNDISNLKMLSRADHMREHCKDENEKMIRRKRMDDIRPLMHEWLRSKEGREKQSKGAIEGWKTRKSVIIICEQCKKEIQTKIPRQRFCSDACDKKWRRNHKLYFIEEICPICDKRYMKDKFSPQRFCSISCGAKNSSKNRIKVQ